jgi:hypothetical protein
MKLPTITLAVFFALGPTLVVAKAAVVGEAGAEGAEGAEEEEEGVRAAQEAGQPAARPAVHRQVQAAPWARRTPVLREQAPQA